MTLEEILAALDNLANLTVDELRTLRDSIGTLYAEMRDGEMSDDVRAALRLGVNVGHQLLAGCEGNGVKVHLIRGGDRAGDLSDGTAGEGKGRGAFGEISQGRVPRRGAHF